MRTDSGLTHRRIARRLGVSHATYTRLENDERRRRLLELGARLFTEHAYDEISMAQIAREADNLAAA